MVNPLRSLRSVERNVLVLGLSSSFGTFANTLWIFFFPLLLESQGASASQIGVVYGVALFLAAIVQIPVGAFADRFGRKTTVVLGSCAAAVSIFVLSFSSTTILSSIAYMSFFAVGGTFVSIGRSALITESVPKEKLATSFGTFITMAGWVSLLAPLLGGLYFTEDTGSLLLVSCVLYIGVAATRAIFLKETLNTSDKATTSEPPSVENQQISKFKTLFSNFRLAFSNRILLGLTIAYAIYGVLFEQVSFVVTLYSESSLHLSLLEIGIMYSILLVVDSQLAIPFGKMADRWNKRNIIIASWLGETAFMMVFAFSVGPLFSLLAYAAWTGFGSMDSPAISALLGIITKKETRGISYGFFNTFSLLLSIPAPIIAGLLYSVKPILPFFVGLAINLIGLLFFLSLVRNPD